jgi:hypothetical protein
MIYRGKKKFLLYRANKQKGPKDAGGGDADSFYLT